VLDADLTLLLHRGACQAKERTKAKVLNVRVVAMLAVLRNRPAP
jgi:hypothetical protein